jgi:hypothetical protein
MSYSRVDGKDTIIFVEPEEHKEEKAPSSEAKDNEPTNAEGEEGQSAAFDPETGEINWDCPCKYSQSSCWGLVSAIINHETIINHTPLDTLKKVTSARTSGALDELS